VNACVENNIQNATELCMRRRCVRMVEVVEQEACLLLSLSWKVYTVIGDGYGAKVSHN
jgi:hypothetical protein